MEISNISLQYNSTRFFRRVLSISKQKKAWQQRPRSDHDWRVGVSPHLYMREKKVEAQSYEVYKAPN